MIFILNIYIYIFVRSMIFLVHVMFSQSLQTCILCVVYSVSILHIFFSNKRVERNFYIQVAANEKISVILPFQYLEDCIPRKVFVA